MREREGEGAWQTKKKPSCWSSYLLSGVQDAFQKVANNRRGEGGRAQSASPGVKLVFLADSSSAEFRLNYSRGFLSLSFSTSVTLAVNFFSSPSFLLSSLLHWLLTGSRNFTRCAASRSRGAVQEGAGLRAVCAAAADQWEPRSHNPRTRRANHVAPRVRRAGGVTASGRGQKHRAHEKKS